MPEIGVEMRYLVGKVLDTGWPVGQESVKVQLLGWWGSKDWLLLI